MVLIKIIQAKERKKLYEPPHKKTKKMAYAPSEDSDQPGHPPSLIRVSPSAWKNFCPIKRTVKTLIRLGRCPGWSDFLAGRTDPFVGFVMRRLITQRISYILWVLPLINTTSCSSGTSSTWNTGFFSLLSPILIKTETTKKYYLVYW